LASGLRSRARDVATVPATRRRTRVAGVRTFRRPRCGPRACLVTPRFPGPYTAPSRGPTQQRCHAPSPGRASVHAPRHLATLRLQARGHPVLSTARASPATPPFTPDAKSSHRRRTASRGGRSARAPPPAAFSATLEWSRSSLPCEPPPPPLP
jgi:hypothetical protein